MVALDIEMPASCDICPLMRCGKCIANDSCKVDVVKPNNCPLHMAPVVKDTHNIPKNVQLKFRFKFCEMCNHCDPVTVSDEQFYFIDDEHMQVYVIHCSHEGACNYIINQRKEIRDV